MHDDGDELDDYVDAVHGHLNVDDDHVNYGHVECDWVAPVMNKILIQL